MVLFAGKRLVEAVEKLVSKTEQFSAMVGRVEARIKGLEDLIARAHFPAEEMHLLAGELRALRYLLDQNGDYKQLDKLHKDLREKRERERQDEHSEKGQG